MKKFSKAFNTTTTRVRPVGSDTFYKVVSINDTRVNIKVEGLCGSFKRSDILRYTNKQKCCIKIFSV